MHLNVDIPQNLILEAITNAFGERLTEMQTIDHMMEFMNENQVAEYFKISRSTVRNWVENHGMPKRPLGNVVIYHRDEIKEWYLDFTNIGNKNSVKLVNNTLTKRKAA